MKSLLRTTRELTETLEKFDIFRPGTIEPTLVQSDSVLSGRDEVDLVFNVKEQPKYFLRTATDVGDGEGNAVSLFVDDSDFLWRAELKHDEGITDWYSEDS